MKNKALLLLLVLYCVFVLFNILLHQDKYLWDFRSYYASATAQAQGLDAYSPFTLFFFRPFTALKYQAAFYLYFFLYCFALAGLIYFWHRAFLEKKTDFIFYGLCLLGFNSAIYLNLRSGNICLFEQLLLWLAFYFYLKKRYIFFCLSIVIAATLNIQPLFFLLLLLFSEDERKYSHFAASLAVFIFLIAIEFFSSPHGFFHFLDNAYASVNDGGIKNPCMLSLVAMVWRQVFKSMGLMGLAKYYWAAYLLVASIILVISFRIARGMKEESLKDRDKWLVFFSCAVFAVITPRFKDYNFIVLIVPAYFLIKKMSHVSARTLFLVLIVLSAVYITFPGLNIVMFLLWNFYPLALALAIWILYICELRKISRQTAITG